MMSHENQENRSPPRRSVFGTSFLPIAPRNTEHGMMFAGHYAQVLLFLIFVISYKL